MHLGRRALRGDHAAVAHLAARLAVEGRAVEQELALLARVEPPDQLALPEHGQHPGLLHHQRLVAQEGHAPVLRHQAHVDRVALHGAHLAGLAGALLLGLQLALEAVLVDPQAAVPGQLLGEVEGQAVGVVELEGVGAVDQPALLQPGGHLLEDRDGLLEGRAEALLLDPHHALDGGGVVEQVGEGPGHALDHRGRQRGQEGALDPQPLAVPQGAPHDLAQHVAAPLVAGDDPVAHQEGGGPQVVGDHAHRHVVVGLPAVAPAAALLDRGDERREDVGLVVGELPLGHGRDALEAHAGVDAGRRQGLEPAARVAVELHEDQVPDLEPAVALALDARALAAGRRLGAGQLVALEVVDLGAGAAGAGVAHGPEVVLGPELQDALCGHVLQPEAVRLAVAGDALLALEDRDLEPLRVEAELLRQELPAEGDGLLLEVVPEGEVAEHLEEGVVAGGLAHVLEVVVLAAGPDALLGGGRAGVVAPLPSQEDVLELVHAGVGEEQGRVALGHQGGAAHHAVPPLLEVLQERAADLVGRHHLRHGLGNALSSSCAARQGRSSWSPGSSSEAASRPSRASRSRGQSAVKRALTSSAG